MGPSGVASGRRAPGGAANGGQQESCLHSAQRNLTLPKLLDEAQVVAAQAEGRVGQAEIEIEERLAVGFKVVGHGCPLLEFFLAASASIWLSRMR
jgi:hypothetical protein